MVIEITERIAKILGCAMAADTVEQPGFQAQARIRELGQRTCEINRAGKNGPGAASIGPGLFAIRSYLSLLEGVDARMCLLCSLRQIAVRKVEHVDKAVIQTFLV